MTQSSTKIQNVTGTPENAPPAPVFILGLHRSGTTILYEMLSALKHWNTLWAWHISNYDEIRAGKVDHTTSQSRFTERLLQTGMQTRGVDSIKAGPETKEEYCFILDNEGYGFRLTDKSLPAFHVMCETIQSTFPHPRPLLLNCFTSADAKPYTPHPDPSAHVYETVRGEKGNWAHHDPRPCQIPPDWSGGYSSIYAAQAGEDKDSTAGMM